MTVFFNKKGQGYSRMGVFLVLLLTAAGLCRAPEARAQAMSGTYNVCSSCGYTTISAAAADLRSKGVNGPVTINIASGTYNENVEIDSIYGVSAKNTVTFRGAGRYSTMIKNTGGSKGGVFQVRNVNYINIKSLSIENTSSSSTKQALHLYYSNYCNVDSCLLVSPLSPSSGNYPLYNYYSIGNTFSDNIVRGGYDVIYNYGQSNNKTYGYHTFRRNRVTGTYYHTFYNYYVNGCTYDANFVDSSITTITYGIYSYYESGAKYVNNVIPGDGFDYYGCYFYNPNYYDQTNTFEVYNNMVGPFPGTEVNYAVYFYFSKSGVDVNFKFVHNTVAMDETDDYNFYMSTNSSTGGITIANNIFSRSTEGELARFNSLKATDVLKYNDYYSASKSAIVYYNGTTYDKISDFLAAAKPLGHGIGAQTTKPPYVSATDLHLDNTNPGPFGINMGVSTDIDGDTRCVAYPSSGADESTILGSGKPKFSGLDTIFINSPTVFTNKSQTSRQVFEWYLDGVKVGDSVHLNLKAGSVGTFPLKLVSYGCKGKDSVTKNVVVVNPSSAPNASFIASENLIKKGAIVRFTDLSTNGASSWKWAITPDSVYVNGNKSPAYSYLYGNSTTQNPVIQFTESGKYKVCLTATNVKGSSTVCQDAYIIVKPSVNMGTVTMITDSAGTLYDNGGPTEDYKTGNTSVLIAPCASEVYLVFKDFNLECGWDYIRIYDGEDNHGIPLHTCTSNINGSYGPGLTSGPGGTCSNGCIPKVTDTFVAKSGKMYIEMVTDGGGVRSGFEAEWWRKAKTGSSPEAGFTVSSDSICTNGEVVFTNTSKGENLSFDWDLDGDLSYFECSGNCKSTSWPYLFAGDYTVTLIARNACGLSDTFTQVIHVSDPPKPVVNFSTDNTNPAKGDIVFLTPDIKECVDDYLWTITSPDGGKVTFVKGTSETSPYPQVIFNDTGCYTVQLNAMNRTDTDSLIKTCFIHVKEAYCVPAVTTLIEDLGISRVVFNTIDKSSAAGKEAYSNFKATNSTSLELGVTYKLQVYRSTNKNPMTRTVWIDWNNDGDFNDPNEKVAEEKNAKTLSWETDITIPAYARLGATTLRIAVNQGSFSNKMCGDNEYGEYEDYRLYITSDRSKPVITLKGADTIVVEQGYAFSDPGATALDNIDGNLTALINVDKVKIEDPTQAFDALVEGTYRFTYTVSDLAGNAADPKHRIVIITRDATAPDLLIEEPDTIIIPLGSQYTAPKVISAIDLLDGDISGDVQVQDTVHTDVVDTFTVHFFISDVNGNTANVYRTVIVVDTSASVIDLIGSDIVTLQVGTAYKDSGVRVSDNYYSEAQLRKRLVIDSTLNTNVLGTYTYTYILTDPSGNKAVSKVRTIIVTDTVKPTVALRGDADMTVEVYDMFVDPGIFTSDNYYKTLDIDTLGTFYATLQNGKASQLGKFTIIYKITDGSGNVTTVTRNVEVVDTKAPVMVLNGDEDVITCRWENYTDAGYTVTDNYYQKPQLKIDTLGTFENTLQEGYYTVIYRATDPSGNVSNSVKRTIWIKSPEQCGLTGIDPQKSLDKAVHIYPNPSNGNFVVEVTNADANAQMTVKVTNMIGQVVSDAQVKFLTGSKVSVDLSSQSAGVYLVTITNGTSMVTKQLILSK